MKIEDWGGGYELGWVDGGVVVVEEIEGWGEEAEEIEGWEEYTGIVILL